MRNKAGYDAVLENNTWEQIAQACASGDSILTTWLGQTKSGTYNNVSTSFRMVDNYVGRYTFADNSNNHAVFEMVTTIGGNSTIPYNNTNDSSGGFGGSSIFTWYYTTFYNRLDTNITAVLKTTNVKSIKGGAGTTAYSWQCKIFPPSVSEYSSIYTSTNGETNGGVFAYYTNLSDYSKTEVGYSTTANYHLRSPRYNYGKEVWGVNAYGSITPYSASTIGASPICFAL